MKVETYHSNDGRGVVTVTENDDLDHYNFDTSDRFRFVNNKKL